MKNRIKCKQIAVKCIRTILFGAIALLFFLPLVWMVSASFKPNSEVFIFPIEWIPKHPQVSNYTEIWLSEDLPFGVLYLNSIKIALLTIIGKLILSASAAYAFSKMHFPLKNVIFIAFLGSMMIPSQVTVLPRFVLFEKLGLYNTHASLIIPALFDVSAIFLLKQFFDAIPSDLSESALIDGAGHGRIWMQIVLPLSAAPLASLAVLALVTSWNDYFNPLIFIITPAKYTVSLGIRKYAADIYTNLGLAASVSAIAPILLLYIFCQRYFVQSIASSGIKG